MAPATYSTRKILIWCAGSLGVLFAHRLLFLLAHWPAGTSFLDVASPMLEQIAFGFAYDLATLPLMVMPLILALPLYACGATRVNRVLRWLEGAQWIYFCALNLILIASTYNYTFNNKHLGWEFMAYLSDLGTLLGGISERSPLLLLAWALLGPMLIFLGLRWLLRRPAAPVYAAGKSGSFWRRLRPVALLYLAVLVALPIALRGGFQESPLRAPDAIRYDTTFLNTLPLNGLFTISRDAQDSSDFLTFFESDANIRFVQGLLDQRTAFTSTEYPLLRQMPARAFLPGGSSPGVGHPPNIVLIILESFTASYLTTHGGDPEIAPNFHALSQRGRYYERFMASGGRSANGIFCMLAGLPDRANRTILRSNESQNRMGGLAKLLGQKGYHSIFVHGGDLRFDSMDRMLPHLGFDEAYGYREIDAEDLLPNPQAPRTSWGYQDGDSFAVLEQRLDALHAENGQSGQPVFASIFTINTHHPFIIPDESFAHFSAEVGEQRDFLNSYRYTDHALGEFMRAMESKPYFKDTIFVLTADHAHHRGLNYLEDRHIPLLLFAPARIAPARVGEVASQLDILPTILGLAGGDIQYAAMGRDLLQPWQARPEQSQPFAYYAGGSNTGVIGWVEGDLLLMQWIGTPHHILLTGRHPANRQDLQERFPARGTAMLNRSRHFHQFARFLERNNRIYPEANPETPTGAEP